MQSNCQITSIGERKRNPKKPKKKEKKRKIHLLILARAMQAKIVGKHRPYLLVYLLSFEAIIWVILLAHVYIGFLFQLKKVLCAWNEDAPWIFFKSYQGDFPCM